MRWNTIILVALALFSVSCARKPERSLVGEWKGTDSTGQTASLVLNTDGNCRMILGNLVLDSQTVGGKMEWRADMSHDPMTLDLVITPASGKHSVLPMIFRFITDQKIQVGMSEDMQSHPTGFAADDTKNQIVLTKQ
jgi:hypothetical protein